MRPTLFELPDWLGGFAVPSYGIIMVLGCLAGALLFSWLASRSGYDREAAFETALQPILIAIVASKVVGLLFQPPSDLSLVQQLVRTGGVWYVGLISGILAAIWRARALGVPVGHGLDLAAASVAVGHGIGRLACLFAGCCYGAECSAPWAVTFTDPVAHERAGTPLHVPLHPTAAYESLGELALAALLIWLIVRRKHRFHFQVALMYMTGYAMLRYVIEFFRADMRGGIGPFSTSQAIAVGVLLITIPSLIVGWRRGTLNPFAGPFPEGDVIACPAEVQPEEG